jgi:hypothetical protein
VAASGALLTFTVRSATLGVSDANQRWASFAVGENRASPAATRSLADERT